MSRLRDGVLLRCLAWGAIVRRRDLGTGVWGRPRGFEEPSNEDVACASSYPIASAVKVGLMVADGDFATRTRAGDPPHVARLTSNGERLASDIASLSFCPECHEESLLLVPAGEMEPEHAIGCTQCSGTWLARVFVREFISFASVEIPALTRARRDGKVTVGEWQLDMLQLAQARRR